MTVQSESILTTLSLMEMDQNIYSEHKDGISWSESVLPFRLHRCRVQTSGWISDHLVDRCSCGALRIDMGHWNFKNNRRRKNPQI